MKSCSYWHHLVVTHLQISSVVCNIVTSMSYNVGRAQDVFDNLDRKEFLDARLRSNPFETIKGVMFQNR